ncbi:aspartic peptidase domain-containing protein [Amylocystis lapponica]|nr:aspartic peptidase domain-containing protein [Amylocystis lapponica]
MISVAAPPQRPWKGKAPERIARRQASDGVVLALEMLTGSMYQSVYTVPVAFGTNQQNLSLQVDTGSADLWVASTSCSSGSCSQTNGRLYDPTASRSTSQTFTINYAEGEVSGPIVWDTVNLGGYVINNQALAAAASVTAEPLEQDFVGILGLALPLDSVISQRITPDIYPDGAALSSNLFGVVPTSTAPGAPFFSLALERPGSTAIPSVLGIGRHPDGLVDDPGKINYAPLVQYSSGDVFWQAVISAITVWVDGKEMAVRLGNSVTGAFAPSAVLDSGTPVILASAAIANGIYGALGITPASDGQYYMPCTTPLNMTITLDDRPPIALHPLDLSYPPPSYSSTDLCTGLIQNSALIGSSEVNVADMILGVPFLRSTYMVMAYEPPDIQGRFPSNSTAAAAAAVDPQTSPRLGLLNLTNPTVALAEFNRVRVLGQPLGNAPTAQDTVPARPGPRISPALAVVIGVLGFLALCAVLFAARWAATRRRARAWVRRRAVAEDADAKDAAGLAYALARRSEHDGPFPSEDTLRGSYASSKHRGAGSYGGESAADEEAPDSDSPGGEGEAARHMRTASGEPGAGVPLLAYAHRRSVSADVTEFGLRVGAWEEGTGSLAGVGTRARGGRVSGSLSPERERSVSSRARRASVVSGDEGSWRVRPPRSPRPRHGGVAFVPLQQAQEEP